MSPNHLPSIIAPLALLFILSMTTSVCDACASRKDKHGQDITTTNPTYDPEQGAVTVRSRDHVLRRRSVRSVAPDQEEPPMTTEAPFPESMSESEANVEIFTWLDIDQSGFLSVIEWSLEGGTVKDFWALLSDHDQDGDEEISREEFRPLVVRVRTSAD